MKKTKLVQTMMISTLALGMTSNVLAANYTDALNAVSDSKIEFIEGDPEILDPSNPDKPITPTNPTNPNKGDLMIQYVSDFDFGVHKKTTKGLLANAKMDKVKNETDNEVLPFVSTLDTRYNREGGWKLEVSSTDFIGTDAKNNEVIIKGAEIVFTHANYAKQDNAPVVKTPAEAEKVEDGMILGKDKQVLAFADATKDEQGVGSRTLALGNQVEKQRDADKDYDYNVTNGVTFRLPKNAPVSATKYQATVNWELSPGI